MAIVLDAMGSDNYPDPEIQAAVDAARIIKDEIILVGHEEQLQDKLVQINTDNQPVRIVHAPDVLEMHEKPVAAARKKPLNSMAVGMKLVKTGEAQAFVTAGNTGGAMFNGLRTLGRIKGVQRPGLTTIFPVKTGLAIVLDIGANADCRPDFLQQFAIMGSVYAEKALGRNNPTIGLLSNGEEEGKGKQLTKDAYPLLQNSGINFVGNIEPKEFVAGKVDVLVSDGFSGNVMIKTSEAVAGLLLEILKESLMSSPITKLGALLAKPAFNKAKQIMNPGDIGAAPLLGIDGLLFVGHGSSDAHALTSAVVRAHEAVQADLLGAIRFAIQTRLNDSND